VEAMGTVVRFANKHDVVNLLDYLQKAKLGTDGIIDSIDYFLLMENSEGEILGTIGIEPVGGVGMLRSLAISETLKEADILLLFNQMLLLAKEKSLSTLYLATNKPDSSTFFQMLGFRTLAKVDVPAQLKQLTHVQYILTVDNSLFMELKL
jgi:N-acetylglutamate synthase-like GNAT family acetyltransferase